MTALIALVRREYIEHRAAFVIAPAILLGLGLLAALYGVVSSHAHWRMEPGVSTVLIFYETVFGAAAYGWSVYLLVMLVFYFSNAFSADSRNNAMLFWKSMPQTDLKILTAKTVAGLTVFPAAVLVAVAITGAIAYLPTMTAGNMLSGYGAPDLVQTATAWARIMLIAAVYIGIALFWYLPYLAWIGMLSTAFGRWAIPLAVLIPLVAGLIEFMILGGRGPTGGYILDFLRERLTLDVAGLDLEARWVLREPLEALPLIAGMIGGVDWISLAGGVAVAVVFIYAASEYRRRFVLT